MTLIYIIRFIIWERRFRFGLRWLELVLLGSIWFGLIIKHMKGCLKIKHVIVKYMMYVSFYLHILLTPLKLTNAAQVIRMSPDHTFYMYFNTCNSSSSYYIFRGSWSLHLIYACMLSLTWRWKRRSSIVNPRFTIFTHSGSEQFKTPRV